MKRLQRSKGLALASLLAAGCLWSFGCTSKQPAKGVDGKGNDQSATASTGATKNSSAKKSVPVKTVVIKKSAYKEFGEYFGTVQAVKQADLVAYAGGRVKTVRVNAGDVVKKGDKLCDIDGERLKIAFESAKLAERIAKQQYDRSRLHLEKGSASKLRTDQVRLEHLQAQEARVRAEKNYRGAFCRAPFSGTVVGRHIEPYKDVAAGQTTLSLADLSQVKILVGIPESAIAGYRPGAEVQVSIASHPDKKWTGTIHSISQKVSEFDRSFTLEVQVKNAGELLKPGITAKTSILRWDLQDQIVVPSEVILTLAKRRVVMLAEDGIAKTQDIEVKTSNERQSLISSGLAPGQSLIISGHTKVSDGSPIQIVR